MVSIEDARAYTHWAGKRSPREWKWQYAAQGPDRRRYPWGDEWNANAMPEPSVAREMPAPTDVEAHPAGAVRSGSWMSSGTCGNGPTNTWTGIHALRSCTGVAHINRTSHCYFQQPIGSMSTASIGRIYLDRGVCCSDIGAGFSAAVVGLIADDLVARRSTTRSR